MYVFSLWEIDARHFKFFLPTHLQQMLFSKNGEVPMNSSEKSRKFVQKHVCQLNQQVEGRHKKSQSNCSVRATNTDYKLIKICLEIVPKQKSHTNFSFFRKGIREL